MFKLPKNIYIRYAYLPFVEEVIPTNQHDSFPVELSDALCDPAFTKAIANLIETHHKRRVEMLRTGDLSFTKSFAPHVMVKMINIDDQLHVQNIRFL